VGWSNLKFGSRFSQRLQRFFLLRNMLVLPTGQILLTDFFEVDIYTPTGTYDPSWAPRIRKAPRPVSPGGSYIISGHKFNGLSQAAAFGDDAQSATNYPLVCITNRATGQVFTAGRATTAAWPSGLVDWCPRISMCQPIRSWASVTWSWWPIVFPPNRSRSSCSRPAETLCASRPMSGRLFFCRSYAAAVPCPRLRVALNNMSE